MDGRQLFDLDCAHSMMPSSRVPYCEVMSVQRFWKLVEAARVSAVDPADADSVGRRARELLDAMSLDEVAELARAEWELRARSYRVDLWGLPI